MKFQWTKGGLKAPGRGGRADRICTLVALALLGLGAVTSLGLVSAAHAATDLTGWCPTADLSGNICVISSGVAEISSNVTIGFGETLSITGSGSLSIDQFVALTIKSGGNLFVDNSGGTIGVDNFGTITNHGSITVENSGAYSIGIACQGILTNLGTMLVENSGGNSYGVDTGDGVVTGGSGSATLTNLGSIVVENTGNGSSGLVTLPTSGLFSPGGTIVNSGSIALENTGASYGVLNSAVFTNNGTMTIQSTGASYGVLNSGVFTNYGTITIQNGDPGSTGIINSPSGVLYNSGTISIENTGAGSYGVLNENFIIYSPYFLLVAVITNECSGTIDIANTGGTGLDNNATIDNYGTLTGAVTEESGGVLNDYSASCGGTSTTTTTTATSSTSTTSSETSTATQSDSDSRALQTDLQGNFSGIFSDFALLQKDLALNFSGFSSGMGLLQSDIQGNFSAISGGSLFNGATDSLHAISSSLLGISTAVSDGFGGVSAALGSFNPGDSVASLLYGIQSSISDGFSQLSSDISSIGASGPLAGTSGGTTVASSSLDAVPLPSQLSASPGNWTQMATASSNEVITGFSVSVTKGGTTQGVLYVTFTDGQCSCTPQTFAIQVGDLSKGMTPVNGVTSPHFSIPAGATVYVQLVSASKASADVQLQFAGIPFSGPTIVGTG